MTLAMTSEATWHDLECGAFDADLPLFGRLAGAPPCRVLDLGAGTGRVSLYLARGGHDVTALDADEELLDVLRERAEAGGPPVAAVLADARTFDLSPESFDLVLAPMQLVQLLGGSEGRAAMFATAARHLRPSGRFALAVVPGALTGDVAAAPLPDVEERDGWVFSSLPVEIRSEGEQIVVRRLRQVSPPPGRGAPAEAPHEQLLDIVSVPGLIAEAEAAGLVEAGQERLPSSQSYVGSTVLILEPGDG